MGKIQVIDNINGHQSGVVYGGGGIAPTLPAFTHGYALGWFLEVKKVEEKKNRNEVICLNSKGGRGGVEGLQPSLQDRVFDIGGVSFAMTTAFQPSILMIGQMDNTQDHTPESANRIYGREGLCPTIPTASGGGHIPKVLDVIAIDEQNTAARKETFGTLTTDGSSPKHNNRVMQIVAMRGRDPENPSDRKIGNKNLVQRLEPNQEGICNTLTTVQKDNMVLEKKNTENIHSVLDRWTWEIDGVRYLIRIRKLTPRECWRLMGFTDEDFEAAQNVNSNTQLYKQAGNSIVKDCLMGIFSQLGIKGVDKWNR